MIKEGRAKKTRCLQPNVVPRPGCGFVMKDGDHRRRERRGFPSDAEDLVAHYLSVTVTCGIILQRAEGGLFRHESGLGKIWRGKKVAIFQWEQDKDRCEKTVKEARREVFCPSLSHRRKHTLLCSYRSRQAHCLNMCEQWRESTRLREERLCLVFCCPWLLLSAGQHISLCWNQPCAVCVCVSLRVCICVSPVNPQEVINALTCSLCLALFPSLSALKGMTGYKPEQSCTYSTVERVLAMLLSPTDVYLTQ